MLPLEKKKVIVINYTNQQRKPKIMIFFPNKLNQHDNVSILPTPHSTLYFDVGVPQNLEFFGFCLGIPFIQNLK
jgi:hypothetical protein